MLAGASGVGEELGAYPRITQNPNSYSLLRAYYVPNTLLGALRVIIMSPPKSTEGTLSSSHLEEAAQKSEVLSPVTRVRCDQPTYCFIMMQSPSEFCDHSV